MLHLQQTRAEWFGHTSPWTTLEHYAHFSPGQTSGTSPSWTSGSIKFHHRAKIRNRMSPRSPWGSESPERPMKPQVRAMVGCTAGMYEEYKEPLYAAPPLLQRMVDAGRLGRKSGSGFYPY